MGYALAQACREAGAEVTLVSGPVHLPCPHGVARIDAASALQMRAAVLEHTADCDIFIAVAAVADYRPVQASQQKIKKKGAPPTIVLTENPDILAEVAALAQPPFCVGFAAESEHLTEHAEAKRRRKGIPLLVGNLVQESMGGDEATLTLFDENGRHPLPPSAKIELARQIVAHIASLQEPV
jgi:phosphopantothenoylcysteine decarboxylase/phosphopantothenate--cysteine ligase